MTTKFVDLPYWIGLVNNLKKEFGWKLVYDCMDLQKGFSKHCKLAEADEENLINNINLVIVASQFLANHILQLTSNYFPVPNVTAYDFFHTAKETNTAGDLDQITPPIIGYYGAIADWFDTIQVGELPKDHPECSFLLISSTQLADLEPFSELNNVDPLGEKPYTEIPKFLSHFDVWKTPFKSTSPTNATNPLKMYEYLSYGKAVLATHLDEHSHNAKLLTLAEKKPTWDRAILESLAEEKTSELLNNRYIFAQTNTWQERAAIIQERSPDLIPLVSIANINYNNLPYLQLSLESIQNNSQHTRYDIMIVDISSVEYTANYLKRFEERNKQTLVIFYKDNLWFAKTNNQGFEIAKGRYLILLRIYTHNNPGWIHRMFWHLETNPTAGAAEPVTKSISNRVKTDVSYLNNKMDLVNRFGILRSVTLFGQTLVIMVSVLLCCIISRKHFIEFNGLDEW